MRQILPITQSEIGTFCNCRVKHFLQFSQMLTPKGFNINLHLGDVMHVCLEYFHKGLQINPREVSIEILRQEEKTDSLSEKNREALDIGIAGLTALLAAYPKYDVLKKFNLTLFKMPESIWYYRDINISAYPLKMKIDLVGIDKQRRAWVIDHKSTSSIDTRLVNSFALNRQAQTYMLGLMQNIAKIVGNDYQIGGFIPNLIRKPMLRQKKNEGTPQYIRRIQDSIESEPEKYFYSAQMHFERPLSKRFQRNLAPTVKEIRKELRFNYPNLDHCNYMGGCPYRPICLDQPGATSMFYKRKHVHPELEERKLNVPVTNLAPVKANTPNKRPLKNKAISIRPPKNRKVNVGIKR